MKIRIRKYPLRSVFLFLVCLVCLFLTLWKIFVFIQTSTPLFWKTYTNTYYGFSLGHPIFLKEAPRDAKSFFLGKRIFFQGDLYQSPPPEVKTLPKGWEKVHIGKYDAIKIKSSITPLGGTIPQETLRYDYLYKNKRITIILYARDIDDQQEKPTGFWTLQQHDIALFETMLKTLRFY